MPLSIFKVRTIRLISVRKSGRVEKLNILLTEFNVLLTELGSQVGTGET